MPEGTHTSVTHCYPTTKRDTSFVKEILVCYSPPNSYGSRPGCSPTNLDGLNLQYRSEKKIPARLAAA